MKKILLLGNPNVGKTMLLNKLCGSNYRVGNWSGVTVTHQEGTFSINDQTFHLFDLPGIYSLLPYSEDEKITIREIFKGNYDLIINVIDIYNLNQNLILTIELKELKIPMIGVLNFYEEFEKSYKIDLMDLEKNLEIPIVPISAKKGLGLEKIKNMINETRSYPSWISDHRITEESAYKESINLAKSLIDDSKLSYLSTISNKNIIFTELLMKNSVLLPWIQKNGTDIKTILEEKSIPNFTEDVLKQKELVIAKTPIIAIKEKNSSINYTKIADTILLHPILGYILCITIMLGLFTMIFNISNPFIDFIDWLITIKFVNYVEFLLKGTSPIIQSFVIQGLIGGVGAVLTFVPLIFILYVFLSFLEESGYLARIAVLLEHPLSKIGLSGKSLFPLLLGFGCTVPAIYGCRVLAKKELRYLTAILASLLSCGARLPVYTLFISAFFKKNGGFILLSLYLLGIFLAIFLAFLISKCQYFLPKDNTFLLVLPKYRIPNISHVIKSATVHATSYIQNAGSIILGMLMLIWVFSYFPNQGDISKSYLAKIGKTIQPIFIPLGFGDRWEAVVSIIPSLIAKESVVGFFGQVLSENKNNRKNIISSINISDEIQEITSVFIETIKISLHGMLIWNFSAPSIEELEKTAGVGIVQKLEQMWNGKNSSQKAYSFMIFILLTLPCVAATAALYQELDRISFIFAIILYTILPFLGSLIFYQVAILFT